MTSFSYVYRKRKIAFTFTGKSKSCAEFVAFLLRQCEVSLGYLGELTLWNPVSSSL